MSEPQQGPSLPPLNEANDGGVVLLVKIRACEPNLDIKKLLNEAENEVLFQLC